MTTTLTPEHDDLLSPAALADPYAVYDVLRAEDPVHWNPRLDAWMILRHDDVLAALTDHDTFRSDRTGAFMGHLSEEDSRRFAAFAAVRRRMIMYNDPPVHATLRRPVQRGMTVRQAHAMRPRIEAITAELVEAIADRPRFDGIRDIGFRLPVIVNSELIGIRPGDTELVKGWTEDFIAAISAGGANVSVEALERGQAAVLAMGEYFAALAEERRAEPRDDLLSALVRRGDPASVSGQDLTGVCVSVMFAGMETTLNLIGNGLLALLRHPDQLALLRERPELLPDAVEELMRYDGTLQLVGRLAARDVTLRGSRIRAGDKVLVMLGAANRDPERFADPHRLDITRRPNPQVGFGHGIHYCPGAEVSRVQGEAAFGTVLRRLPGLRLDDAPLEWQPNMSFRGLRRLPLAHDGAGAP